MYEGALLIAYVLVICFSLGFMIGNRDYPARRRTAAVLGIAGILAAPTVLSFALRLLASVLSAALVIFMVIAGMILMCKAVVKALIH